MGEVDNINKERVILVEISQDIFRQNFLLRYNGDEKNK